MVVLVVVLVAVVRNLCWFVLYLGLSVQVQFFVVDLARFE